MTVGQRTRTLRCNRDAHTQNEKTMPEWTLIVGGRIKRTELHQQFGGSRQSGISPSAKTPNVFLFSDPNSGEQHGYFDRWTEGAFHYTGEGQHGDQQMTKGNLAIQEAQSKGRALRVFKGTGGFVEYMGRFQLDTAQPFYETTSSQTGGGTTRKVIIFKLRPLDGSPPIPAIKPPSADEARVNDVPVEENNTERTLVDPTPEPYEAERRESALVQQFKVFMESRRYTVRRNEIIPPGETRPLYTDVYVKELHILVEAKGSIDRNAIRMAIGQLLDYKRFIVEASVRCAVLLPELPRPDLLQLLAYADVLLYIPDKGEFVLMDGNGQRINNPPDRHYEQ
jgi:hypothetical protein